ncbi:MAG: TonB-dependent receptor [Candidatus Marinimicrobia bacterium]|nr:TonB-dependent receptor [Candidatus Neomarinimicrobiota bacterium]MBT5785193.1 TonB-dependent receptor [Candidatus Neomarinimicrobiota bacterium]MBT6002099.1 TonB-dependent receptor [Candidatus Neomarinimicrobiota bacterium]MBT6304216.1 TonB-dependent receptor [Candidatus Neomarinimicrobiota bacterium]MBT6947074.1 TonB-dependent receptor [Candidatus Neomarinimicrobiota bacterium]
MRTTTRILITVLIPILVLSQNPSTRSNAILKGKLLDAETHNPILGANILIFQSSDSGLVTGTTSDQMGVFTIDLLLPETYDLEIQYIGYETHQIKDISIPNSLVDLGDLYLLQANLESPEIIAAAQAPDVRFEPGKTVITVGDSASVEGETAVDLLENAPSVTFDEDESAAIRGQKAAIYIDGVKTNLEDMLSQIPAGSIQSIEVIPNPSAKYESSSGGVIDIKLKKHKKKGSSGRLRLGYHDSGDYQISANASTNVKGFNAFGEFSDRLFTRSSDTRYWRETYSDNPWFLNLTGENDKQSLTRQYRMGTRWSASKRHAFRLTYLINIRLKDLTGSTHSDRLDSTQMLQRFTEKEKESSDLRERDEISLIYNFDAKTSRSNLNVLFTQSLTASARDGNDQKQNFDPQGFVSGNLKSDSLHSDDDRDQTTIKIDWSLPALGQHEIDLGYQFRSDNNLLRNDYFSLLVDESGWSQDSFRGGPFSYNEIMHGSYISYRYSTEHYQLNLGTRLESITNESVHNDTGSVNNRYDQVLPSLQFIRMITPLQTLQFSYSRRISPPAYNRLNPQVINTSTYFLKTGNPYLKPEQIDNYELQYIWRNEKHTISSSLFYREIDDIIGNQIEIVSDSITHIYPDNLSSGEAIGGDINWVYKTATFMKISGSIVHFNSMLLSEGDESLKKRQKVTTSAKIKLDLNLKKQHYFQIIHKYESPRITWQGSNATRQFTDVSLKTYLWDRKVNLSMKVSDVFDTLRDEKEIDYRTDFFARNISEYDSKRFIMSISYSFNNQWKKNEKK